MKIPQSIYRWVSTQNSNLPLIALVTFSFPASFVKSIYSHNKSRNLWQGKKTCISLSFDCDYPEDALAIPSIVEMLKTYKYKASFAVVGHWLEKYPKEHEPIVKYGHEVMNHTFSHPDNEILNPGRKFREISKEEKAEEIINCATACKKILGVSPIGFRVPHFKNLFTPDIYSILKDIGYIYSSSTWLTNTTSYGLPFEAHHGILEFPLSTCPSHPFTVFDTWHSLRAKRISHRIKHRDDQSYLRLFQRLIDFGKQTGSYINIYLDPLDVSQVSGFRQMLNTLADPEIEVVTYQEYIQKRMHIEHV